jgi:NitT/TauT family transport system ATP-binding protein
MNVICASLRVGFPAEDGRMVVLDNLSLAVPTGAFVAVIGPSGCGKTTLLRTIAGILSPEQGQVIFDPAPATGRPAGALVFQERSLFPWMTALDNAVFGMGMRGEGKADRERAAMPLFERLGLRGREHAYPDELSAGMKQRVAVMRAFLSAAPLLLLDEPFGALDSRRRFALQTELVDLWKRDRKTIILVTHDVDEALYVSDRVLVLSDRPARVIAEHAVPGKREQRDPAALCEEGLVVRREILEALGSPVASSQAM